MSPSPCRAPSLSTGAPPWEAALGASARIMIGRIMIIADVTVTSDLRRRPSRVSPDSDRNSFYQKKCAIHIAIQSESKETDQSKGTERTSESRENFANPFRTRSLDMTREMNAQAKLVCQ